MGTEQETSPGSRFLDAIGGASGEAVRDAMSKSTHHALVEQFEGLIRTWLYIAGITTGTDKQIEEITDCLVRSVAMKELKGIASTQARSTNTLNTAFKEKILPDLRAEIEFSITMILLKPPSKKS